MTTQEGLSQIHQYLLQAFQTEEQKVIDNLNVPIYAQRKAGLNGTDYIFVFDGKDCLLDLSLMEKYHQQMRQYVDGFYKVPKLMRLKVPNILTIFVSDSGFDERTKEWAVSMKRNYLGGEIYGVGLIDLASKCFYHQGVHRTKASGNGAYVSMTFNSIDPQNRSYGVLDEMTKLLGQGSQA